VAGLQLQLGGFRRMHHRIRIDRGAVLDKGGRILHDRGLAGERESRRHAVVPILTGPGPDGNWNRSGSPIDIIPGQPNAERTEDMPMKAAYYEKTGGPEVIQYGELPNPEAKAGEVLVKVGAASLNPIDTYIRSGMVNMPLPKPFVPGCDLAGTVEVIGPDVKRFKVGDRVWGSNQGLKGRQGTFAEYAAVAEDWLYPTPTGVSDAEAAAVALVGITAHLGLFRCAQLKAGETVFVNGGTGGVGSMVVQMTKAAGAKAITTVGSADKAEIVRKW